MSHQEKQSIFDEYAKSVCEEYNNWIDLCMDHFETNYPKYMDAEQFFSSLMFHVHNACDLVQSEQQKKITAEFSNYVEKFKDLDNHPPDLTDFHIMENIITNPENKIH